MSTSKTCISFSAIFFFLTGYNDATLENDISLLKLAGQVTYTDYIIPVCLPTQGVDATVGQMCWITGWGETESKVIVYTVLYANINKCIKSLFAIRR